MADFHKRKLSIQSGTPIAGTGLARIHDGTRFDSRYTLNSIASGDPRNATGPDVFLLPGAIVAKLTETAVDIIDVPFYDNFTGATGFSVSIGGATSGAGFAQPVGTGTSKWRNVRLVNPTTNGWAAGTSIALTGIATSNTMVVFATGESNASGGIVAHNLCASGSSAQDWASIIPGGGHNLLRMSRENGAASYLPFEYDVVHLTLGFFDAVNGRTPAQFKADMQVIHDYYPNSDFVIHAQPVPGQLSSTPSTWLAFLTAMFELADLWDCPVVDVQAILGGYTVEAALGLTGDTTAHLLQTAYDIWGVASAKVSL